MNPVAMQSLSLLDTSGRSAAQPAATLLPAGGSLQATVRQVSQDQLNPQVFRVRMESEGKLLELRTPQPLPTGSVVTLHRSADGQQISIRTDTPSVPQQSTTAAKPDATANLTGRVYQVPVSLAPNQPALTQPLNQLLPRLTAIPVQIVQQIAPTAIQAPASPATSQPTTQALPMQTLQQIAPTSAQASSNPAASQPTAVLPTTAGASSVTSQVTPQITAQASPQPLSQPSANVGTTLSAPTGNTTPAPPQQAGATIPQPQSTATQQPTAASTSASEAPTSSRPTPAPYAAANLTTQAHTTHTQLSVAIKGRVLNLLAPANLPSISQAELIRPAGEQLLIRFAAPAATSPSSTTSNTSPPLTASQAQVVQQGLREVLPQQAPIAEGLNQLMQLQSASSAPQVTDKVVQSLLQLFGVRPGTPEAPETIRQNVNLGGLFTENQLAKKTPIAGDMKQFLGKLQALADQLPIESRQLLQGTIDKMLNRITSQQLTHLQQRQERIDSTDRFFQLDLPVKYQTTFENVELRIQQREKNHVSGEKEKIWQVHLYFDLLENGQIDADLSLNEQQHTVTAAFFCSDRSTVNKVNEHLEGFKQQLQALGLNTTSVTCRQGQAQQRTKPVINTQLIDVKT